MHINFYKNNIDCAVVIPTLVYEINVKVKGNSESYIDILGETILSLIETGETLDIDKLLKLIGIPFKYKKLLECEINELLDNRVLSLDEEGKVAEINNSKNYHLETFYVIYDRVNKILLDYIIPKDEFRKRYLKTFDFDSNKTYYLGKESRRYIPEEKYKLCYQLQELINKSNNLSNLEEDEESQEEDDNFIRPFYEIHLDTIENIDNPIEADFLIKIITNENQEIQFESPFYNTTYSKYIESCIKSKVDEAKILNILKKEYQIYLYLDKCKEKSMTYVNEYSKYDKDKSRLSEVEKISLYKEVLLLEGDAYKSFSLVIENINKILKSLLKECTISFAKSLVEKKNICINNLVELRDMKEILLVKSFIYQRQKFIHKDREIIKSIGESSIVSYLKCIFISKFLTNNPYEARVFDIFSKDVKLMSFMNEAWLYRNNTSHNIEKQEIYKSEYDMDNMQKERLIEVISELMDGLMYFVQTIKEIK
ncbi:hypothetical protein GKZ28_22670 [Clostridium chromiireducens]|uniref:Uncharacterized protein n=1 Tax=Clostridium chromiireducens TaxID=225345 RepID=A0A964RRQ9_9CLOT|nr:hypothetical protein [Clostridium chromiireducens]MVX66483.1 hypothetical protein [Clostridium chromiireducens]